jgi:hypothetical protein
VLIIKTLPFMYLTRNRCEFLHKNWSYLIAKHSLCTNFFKICLKYMFCIHFFLKRAVIPFIKKYDINHFLDFAIGRLSCYNKLCTVHDLCICNIHFRLIIIHREKNPIILFLLILDTMIPNNQMKKDAYK